MSRVEDAARLAAVRATGLLDTGPEEAFDRLARLAGSLLSVPYAFVTVVDETRSFWKSSIGIEAPDRQIPLGESLCLHVIEADGPVIVTDARLYDLARSNPLIESLHVAAWASYPLRSIDDHVLGAFCVLDTVVRDWSVRELETVSSLASAVESEIRLRVIVNESASSARQLLYEMEVRQNLASLAGALVAAGSTDDVSSVITGLGGVVLGAEFALVALLDAERRSLRIHTPDTLDPAMAAKYVIVSLSDVTPLGDAVHFLKPVVLGDYAAHVPRYEHLVADAKATGLVSTAAWPLIRSDGVVVGALGVGWSHPTMFTNAELAMLDTVASMSAQAIERAQLGDLRDELIKSLQRQLLPNVQHVAGLETAVRYLPATYGIGFGGDWYDTIVLGDGRSAFVIGDIAGHGIEAAARMAQVRGAINALTRLHANDLPSVFDDAEEILGHLDDLYIATLAVFVIDLATSTITYVSAGHPPAVVIKADGTCTTLEGGRRPVLGQGGPRPLVGTTRFEPGTVLIAYTDGLIERRTESIDVGLDRLREIVRQATLRGRLDPETLVDELVSSLLTDNIANDDVAVLVVRNTT